MAVEYVFDRSHILEGIKCVHMTSEMISFFSCTSTIIPGVSREVSHIKVSS